MDIYQILVTHNREWTAREFLFFVIVFIVVAFCLRQLVKRQNERLSGVCMSLQLLHSCDCICIDSIYKEITDRLSL